MVVTGFPRSPRQATKQSAVDRFRHQAAVLWLGKDRLLEVGAPTAWRVAANVGELLLIQKYFGNTISHWNSLSSRFR